MLLIESPVGITYQNQCDGLHCDVREAEGFLIPIRGGPEMDEIMALFESGDGTREALKKAVGELSAWLAEDPQDPFTAIELDEDRFNETLEAWVPVKVGENAGLPDMERQ